MNCHDSFWFWFMRPVAEALGAVALVAAVLIPLALLFWLSNRPRKRK